MNGIHSNACKAVREHRYVKHHSVRLAGISLAIMLAITLTSEAAHAAVCTGSFAAANEPVAANNALACGTLASATGAYSLAAGTSAAATGKNSIALGYNAQALSSHDTIAVGANSETLVAGSIAIGGYAVPLPKPPRCMPRISSAPLLWATVLQLPMTTPWHWA